MVVDPFLVAGVALFVCIACITIGSAVFAYQPSNKAAAGAVIAFLYLFSPAYNVGLGGNLGLYIVEIMPFSLRMRGQACYQLFGTSASLLSTYTVPIGLQNLKWKFYIIFLPWIVIEFVVVYFFFPETKGPSLEEICMIFDGDDVVLHSAREKPGEIEYVENQTESLDGEKSKAIAS